MQTRNIHMEAQASNVTPRNDCGHVDEQKYNYYD